jgi:hypothetical protein
MGLCGYAEDTGAVGHGGVWRTQAGRRRGIAEGIAGRRSGGGCMAEVWRARGSGWHGGGYGWHGDGYWSAVVGIGLLRSRPAQGVLSYPYYSYRAIRTIACHVCSIITVIYHEGSCVY